MEKEIIMILYDETGKKHRVKNGTANTKAGRITVEREGIIEKDGLKFFAAKANLLEETENFRMGGRPTYPYDAGIMHALINVRKGTKLLESGTGSGASAYLAWSWGAEVTSYEKEEEFHKKARQNLESTGVKLVHGNVTQCPEKEHYDSIFLDLANPEQVIPSVAKCLKNGGMIGYFSPVINEGIREVLEESGFIDIRGIILNHQVLRLKKKTGIEDKSLGYPGFFVWARKAQDFRIKKKFYPKKEEQ